MALTEKPRIPGYRLDRVLGKGAMSIVYLAVQESLARRVALKVLDPTMAADPAFSKRFAKEGRIIAKLGHPHIVTIYDTATQAGYSYIAMEYLAGGSLKERIRSNPLPPHQAVAILLQIAQALAYAHRQQCIHRDLKPANILFRDVDTAVLTDFGIAKNLEDTTQLTAAGWRIGTPNYMSPEQALGKPVDARADLYSLGVLFYEMLTGQRPYQGKDAFETATLHIKAPIPKLPAALQHFQAVVEQMLAKKLEQRFSTAEALAQAVQQAAHSALSPIAVPTPAPVPDRRRLLWTSVVLLGIALVVLGVLWASRL